MLDSESATTDRSSVRQGEQAQRKKEKRRRQQQAKREAAAHRAHTMTHSEPEQASEPVPEPEPEQLDHQPAPLSPAVQAPASPCVDPESDEAMTGGRTPPDEFCCPITSECMRDPVIVTATGMTYEREAIAKWLSEHDIDPSTGVELGGNKLLAPNVSIRKMIDAWSHGCLGI